jgi:hypothetical protein
LVVGEGDDKLHDQCQRKLFGHRGLGFDSMIDDHPALRASPPSPRRGTAGQSLWRRAGLRGGGDDRARAEDLNADHVSAELIIGMKVCGSSVNA